MKIYVAGSSLEISAVQQAQTEVRAAGHEITEDWTLSLTEVFKHQGKELARFLHHNARADMDGVILADAIILLNDPKCGGAYVELGIALAFRIPVFVIGREKRDILFFHLPQVKHVSSVAEVLNLLRKL